MQSHFFIKFNVLYLGGLSLSLLFLVSIIFRARLEMNTGWMWTTNYLNGYHIATLFTGLLFVAIISYLYALWKTWNLTESETLINTTRVLAFVWLIGAPVFIASTGMFWISMMRLITDRLFAL